MTQIRSMTVADESSISQNVVLAEGQNTHEETSLDEAIFHPIDSFSPTLEKRIDEDSNDSKKNGYCLKNNSFLDVKEILNIFRSSDICPLQSIPDGTKENIYFAISNEQNEKYRKK